MDKISVIKIVHSTSVDGVGLRNSLYVAGCPLRCKGCHNQSSWDIKSGNWLSVEDIFQQLNIDDFNISILGGEPLMQYESVVHLCKLIKERLPHKTIWMWSGYTLKDIELHFPNILKYIDVLVDGPYLEEYKTLNLPWRGSINQKLIYINSTRFK